MANRPKWKAHRRPIPVRATFVAWARCKDGMSKDKSLLIYNSFLTLKGIPPESYEYRLGNRSAVGWIVDQYQVSTETQRHHQRPQPRRQPRFIGQVVQVSLETVNIVKALPKLGIEASARGVR